MKFIGVSDNGLVCIEVSLKQKNELVDFLNVGLHQNVRSVTTEASIFLEDVRRLTEEISMQITNGRNILLLKRVDVLGISSMAHQFLAHDVPLNKYGLACDLAKKIYQGTDVICKTILE